MPPHPYEGGPFLCVQIRRVERSLHRTGLNRGVPASWVLSRWGGVLRSGANRERQGVRDIGLRVILAVPLD
jgi:hypothetical protein